MSTRACAARVRVLGLSVLRSNFVNCLNYRGPNLFCLSVCYHIFFHHAQQTCQKVTPSVSALHLLHFKTGDFFIKVLHSKARPLQVAFRFLVRAF